MNPTLSSLINQRTFILCVNIIGSIVLEVVGRVRACQMAYWGAQIWASRGYGLSSPLPGAADYYVGYGGSGYTPANMDYLHGYVY